MLLRQGKATIVVALILAFSILPVGTGVVAAQGPTMSTPQTTGILSTRGNRNILVDKNEASTGATILDGATLETSDCVTAIVRLERLNEVELATNTVATINFSNGKIKVTLTQGCVKVRTTQDVEATIVTPDGKSTPVSQPGSSNGKFAEVCYPSGANSDFSPSCSPVALYFTLSSIVGAATTALFLIGSNRASAGENPSLSSPS